MPWPAGTVGHQAERNHDRRRRLPRRLPGMRGRILERRVELREKLVGGGLAPALTTPHHAAAAVITDQRQVPVSLAPGDLVDRDLKQIAETVQLAQVLVGDALDDPPDRVPVGSSSAGRSRGLVRVFRRQPRDQVLEVARGTWRRHGRTARPRPAPHARGRPSRRSPHVNLEPPDPEGSGGTRPSRDAACSRDSASKYKHFGQRRRRARNATVTTHPIRLEDDLLDPHPGRSSKRENAALTRTGDDLQVRTIRQPEPTI